MELLQHKKIVGRYVLQRPLGGGGQGRVWLALDEVLMREVAAKQVMIPPGLDPKNEQRLRKLAVREAQAASQINHPNAVRVYDVVHSDEWPWIIMEYVPSESLYGLMKRFGRLNPQYVAGVGVAVLDALTAAHRAGVLHRDVTPHNILIGDDRRVVLTDFGLAAFNPYDGRTVMAGYGGTPLYVAPERVRDGTSIPEGDLWSLGAAMYAAVEGRAPYARENIIDTLAALMTLPPDPPRFAGPLTNVLAGVLRHDPKRRIPAPEMRQRLVNVVHGLRDQPMEHPPVRQRLQSAPTMMLG